MALLGLLSPEFPSDSLSANLDAMAATGAVSVQFDLVSAVASTFPIELSEATIETIKACFSERRLTMAALSGTYNMIDPDPQARALGAKGLNRVIALAPKLGAQVVTLCTGSRDPEPYVAKASGQRHSRGVGRSARTDGGGGARRGGFRGDAWGGARSRKHHKFRSES